MTAAGGVLVLDLSRRAAAKQPLTAAERRDLGGGGLLGVELLTSSTAPGLDPFDPRAAFVLAGGPATGVRAVGLPRCTLVAKSPLSGGVGEARVPGPLGIALRRTGHDAVLIHGRARTWSYLLLCDGRPHVVAAPELFGLDTAEKTDVLKERHGGAAAVAVIGAAGERLVRYASVVSEYGYTASRMGLGAVLGAKHLLGVVVTGGEDQPIADFVAVAAVTARYVARMDDNALAVRQRDAPGLGAWPGPGREGYLGIENFRTAQAGDWSPFAPERFAERVGETAACPGCPQDCLKRYPAAGSDARASVLHEDAVAAFAANLGIRDLESVLQLNARCNLWGVDPVSLSWTLSAVIEAAADGALEGPLAGLAPAFGDGPAIGALCADVVHRRGAAAVLAEGSARLAAAEPRLAPYAMQVKGVEVGPWDPRGSHGQALAYAFSPVGPRYDQVEHDIDFDPAWGSASYIARARRHGCPSGGIAMNALDDRKVQMTISLWELWSGYDVLGLCNLAAPPTRALEENEVLELARAVTGWDVTHDEVAGWGRRRIAQMRAYNTREGLGPEADSLPSRFYDRPVDAGRLRGSCLDRRAVTAGLEAMRQRWDGASPTARMQPRTDEVIPA